MFFIVEVSIVLSSIFYRPPNASVSENYIQANIAKVNILGRLKRLLAEVLIEEILNVHCDAETVS